MNMKNKDIPEVRSRILKEQRYMCMICRSDLRRGESKDIVLDHCHASGYIRGVLCRNCNGVLGRVEGWANRSKKGLTKVRWIENVAKYLKETSNAPAYDLVHPTFKTPNEKRELKNRRARLRRARDAKGKK